MPTIKPGTLFVCQILPQVIQETWEVKLPLKYKYSEFGAPKVFIKCSSEGVINWKSPKTQIFTESELKKLKNPVKIIKLKTQITFQVVE